MAQAPEAGTESEITIDESGIYIIWLDSYIGVLGDYESFKRKFHENLRPVNGLPPRSINNLILYFEQNISPIKYVSKIDDALHLVQSETKKRIILISSGLLGRDIIPFIVQCHPHVYWFYVFCLDMASNSLWAGEYAHCLHMFTHETELLVRLARDISKEYITLGRSYLAVDDGESARKYFVAAEMLEIHANDADTLNPRSETRLNQLQGPDGLIERARNLRDDQERNETVVVNDAQFILLDLSSIMSSNLVRILHFLQIFLPEKTILIIDDLASDVIFSNIGKPVSLFARDITTAEQFKARFNLLNVSIYLIEHEKIGLGTIDNLIDRLVELIVEQYRQQARRHHNLGHKQLADIEIKTAQRITHEVDRIKNS